MPDTEVATEESAPPATPLPVEPSSLPERIAQLEEAVIALGGTLPE